MKTPSRPLRALLALFLILPLTGCPKAPPPPQDGAAPTSTHSGWQSTVRSVLDTLQWSLPVARLIVSQWDGHVSAAILRALATAKDTTLPGLQRALATYERQGGDTCAVRAATLALAYSLVSVSNTLAAAGWGTAEPIGLAIQSLSGLLDNVLAPCGATGTTRAFILVDAGALRPFPVMVRPPRDAGHE